jgi:hypothetical protein
MAARENEVQWKKLKYKNYFLPPNAFQPAPVSLSDAPQQSKLLFSFLSVYASRLPPEGSNTTHTHLSQAFRSMVKHFEYMWQNGIYDLKDWDEVAATELAKKLGEGGWTQALNIDERTRQAIGRMTDDVLARFVSKAKSKSGGYSLSDKFAAVIGTNCRHTELISAKLIILKRLGLIDDNAESKQSGTPVRRRSSEAGMIVSHLRQELRWINLLSAPLPTGEELTFVPYPDTVKIAEKFGRKGGRTGNLTPDIVAALLKESASWILEHSPHVIGLLEDIISGLIEARDEGRPRDVACVERAIKLSRHASELAKTLGEPILTITLSSDPNGTSVKRLIYNVASACFVVISFLNARRKNELQHKKHGLHRNALRRVDRSLDLHECEFYIEKTFKRYVPFYVGRATTRAIRVLESLSDCARTIDDLRADTASKIAEDLREDKLFQLPRVAGKRDGGGAQWFDFVASVNGIARELIERALGSNTGIRVHAHMFRRAYALIFHYRFENATLVALAQQLGHFDLETVLIYVTDVFGGVDTATASSYARGIDEAREKEQQAIRAEVKQVGFDRVRELAEQVVAGRADASGGFARLVTRFHQRLGRNVSYARLSAGGKAKALGDVLVHAGHQFRPMRHANCVASASRRSKSAACYSMEEGRNMPEDASPDRCGACPYSHFVQAHIDLWRADAQKLDERAVVLGCNTVAGQQAIVEVSNLRRAIQLHGGRTHRAVAEAA